MRPAGSRNPNRCMLPADKSQTRFFMIRRIFVALFLLASICAGAGGCAEPSKSSQTIYVSILPLRTLVYGIVGDGFRPETFEPSARQFAALKEAQLVFNVGLIDFEQTLLSKMAEPEKTVNLSEGIDLIEGCCSHGTHAACGDGTHRHGVDPHVWTSPRALRRMADNAYAAIRRIWPDSTKYAANHARLVAEIDRLDERVRTEIAESGTTRFMIFHPALTYYANDYGIRQIAVEQGGKEPSAKRLAALIRQVREEGIDRIFYQRQFPRSTVEAIARDMGAEPVEIDPLREDVLDNILVITESICGKR